MSKGELPIPHMIAIALGVLVIVLVGFFLFQQSGQLGEQVSKQDCLRAVTEYCSFYSADKSWDKKYGTKPTQQNCVDYQVGKYDPCSKFGASGTPGGIAINKPTSITIKPTVSSVLLDASKILPITGHFLILDDNSEKSSALEISLAGTLTIDITFDQLSDQYELLLQYRKKGDTAWSDYGTKKNVADWDSKLKEGNTLKFKTTLSSLKEPGVYKVRIIGDVESLSSDKYDLESNIIEIKIKAGVTCSTQCGSKLCKSYETCIQYDEQGIEIDYCKLAASCGATCNSFVTKYPTFAKIKEQPCNKYDNCVGNIKDDFGNSYTCVVDNKPRYVCIGKCDVTSGSNKQDTSMPKTPPFPACADGTKYGECSKDKKYCDNGNLVSDIDKCGCPLGDVLDGGACKLRTGYTCQENNDCQIEVETSFGYVKLFDSKGELVARAPCQNNLCNLPGSFMKPVGAQYKITIEWIGNYADKTITIG